jgi:DNA-3-methyladenine glycosylase II
MIKESKIPLVLNKELLSKAVQQLTRDDPDLAVIINTYGMPVIKFRKQTFATLVYIILEQQVSLASAKAVYNKLLKSSNKFTPELFLTFNDDELKRFGFSRQKADYCRILARAVLERKLILKSLRNLYDDNARIELMKIKGIGKWTADIYLMFALKRPDIWPVNDMALISAVHSIKKISKKPDNKSMTEIAEHWKPWRSVSARILWHYYLSK